MPATKKHVFDSTEIQYSLIGRALAHPARIRIIEILNQRGYVRNTDLSKMLHLSKTAVSNHIKKLEDASIVKLTFEPNCCFQIALNSGAQETVRDFVHDIFVF